MLSEPHAAPLARYVKSLREQGLGYVPDFDPMDGGTRAQALFIFQKPGQKTFDSGFISRNNNDKTAENTFNFMVQAGLSRKEVCIWNVVPGLNDKRKIYAAELRSGVESLKGLFPLLPNLRVVMFVGEKAKRARSLLDNINLERRLLGNTSLELLESYLPSRTNHNCNRHLWDRIPPAWSLVRESLDKPR